MATDLTVSMVGQGLAFAAARVVSTRPATLLLAAPHAVVVSASVGREWVIPERRAVVAWTGDASAVFGGWGRGVRVRAVAGAGSGLNPQVAVAGGSEAVEVELEKGETVRVVGGSVLAYSVGENETDDGDDSSTLSTLSNWTNWQQWINWNNWSNWIFGNRQDLVTFHGPRTIYISSGPTTDLPISVPSEQLKQLVK